MGHKKYTTDAIVLGGFEIGEADKTLILYTHDFGLIYAQAMGLRKEQSKIRFVLQNYCLARVSLVRGRSGWRVVGACASIATQCSISINKVRILSNISNLVRRLVQGEESNTYLFKIIQDAYIALANNPKDLDKTIELVCVARVLCSLGYLSTKALGNVLDIDAGYDFNKIVKIHRIKSRLTRSVNEALLASQL